jgi:hypothetical protein
VRPSGVRSSRCDVPLSETGDIPAGHSQLNSGRDQGRWPQALSAGRRAGAG